MTDMSPAERDEALALVQQLQGNPHPQAFKAAGVWPKGKSYHWPPGKQGARERARRQRQAAKARG